MPNAFSTKKNGIVEVHISLSSITKRFSSMENERNINALLLLSLAEFEQRLDIIYQGAQLGLVSDQVKPCDEVLSTWFLD